MNETRYIERLRHGLAGLLHHAIVEQDIRIYDLSALTGIPERKIKDVLSAKSLSRNDLTLGEIGALFEMLNHDLNMEATPSVFPETRVVMQYDEPGYQIDMFANAEGE
mgnify:CR=1 FL=1